ncbi:bifunctional diaminohydroxyphosphoribosylaminopyrimidine deaminase/5-amino-6-(5-phosphoribosylamino)uracil reductase RibD [Entomobacter blattae]|uniref:Riboflavin biosynthesis protein RibD n=1 Tax=Entomobacter blattae TaxID=2762277 RepID=A0A7H1NP36_9PROT|nr:bifunctional diaminohydroxyphosphoribosylaminopyrimidine deaminase/5-amino-6-(5-phosphoribosylamino)uracil reductase RibD [Entomobacter blattae]QNT77546.1 Cytidine and deoxycytidylate deaminase zinc-binding region [Entomobacter blattae]
MQAFINSIIPPLAKEENPQSFFPEAIHQGFLQALAEAFAYCGATAPNPPVGCAILNQKGEVLTVAAHHRAGTLHAEALALKQCREKGLLEQAHTAIVTLEPCNHTGRTPPCTEALIKSPIRTVWVGLPDPNPQASGGLARLQAAGFSTFLLPEIQNPQAQAMARFCQSLLAPFSRTITLETPWITVKQALTPQGSMVPPHGQKTFTSAASLKLAHQLRRATDAIITGLNTFLIDTPSLTVRHIPDHSGRAPRLLVICSRKPALPQPVIITAEQNGFIVEQCQDLSNLTALLKKHHVLWAMVEGGPALLKALDEQKLWQDWLTIQSHPDAPDTLHPQTAPWLDSPITPLTLFLAQTKTGHSFSL